MLTNKDDYGYIQVFIDYLKQLFDMIMKLFRGSNDDAADDEAVETPVEP